MKKTILITGATDGIGLETAKLLVSMGHHVLLHGRSPAKLERVEKELAGLNGGTVDSVVADLSVLSEVNRLVAAVTEQYKTLDVVINNAGVYSLGSGESPITSDGLDIRFTVNTIAPYVLSKKLMPLIGESGRIINLSSAAQAPVNVNALAGGDSQLSDGEAYAQSKLAMTMWSCQLGLYYKDSGPMIVAVNPGSLLGSKMVKDAFGIAGGDLGKGADILVRAAVSDEFLGAEGRYFDNDSGQFASPHPDALDDQKNQEVIAGIENVLNRVG